MKCPKCNFISFDYNQTCPKCGIDLSHEKNQLNLPSYKPKPLPLLGGLTEDSEIPDHETMIKQSEILKNHPEAAEDLLISLDTLSDNEPAIQLEPEPASSEPETIMEDQVDDALEELSISLDDLSDEPELQLSEEGKPEKDALWETRTVEKRIAEVQIDKTSENQDTPFDSGEGASVKAKVKEPSFEIELEPLGFDFELEESDKKKP